MIRIIECCVCNKMTKANLILRDINICASCEQKILKAQTDHKDYSKYKEGIKRILCYDHGYKQ